LGRGRHVYGEGSGERDLGNRLGFVDGTAAWV
jgi:hypothetical protein